MIKSIWKRFLWLDFRLKLVLLFCLFGLFLNTLFLCRDVQYGGVLLRLHAGFWVLYAGQVVFIMLRERMVFVLSLLQTVLAFLTSADFTFVPVLRVLGYTVHAAMGGFTLEDMEVYKYVFMSAALTLELLKTAWLWLLLPAPGKRSARPQPSAPAKEA